MLSQVFHLFVSCSLLSYAAATFPQPYDSLNIRIDGDLPKSQCSAILASLENALQTASLQLFAALKRTYYIGDVNVLLPAYWGPECLPADGRREPNIRPATETTSDITVTGAHALLGDQMWTKQHGDCGAKGTQIYAPHHALHGPSAGSRLAKEWLKYRYGVFDEIGVLSDPTYPPCYAGTQSRRVTGCAQRWEAAAQEEACQLTDGPDPAEFFGFVQRSLRASDVHNASLLFLPGAVGEQALCDAHTHDRDAPTKQNYFCGRQSVWQVIRQHGDFAGRPELTGEPTAAGPPPPPPTFHYTRPSRTRYVVVVDMTPDIAVRESWSFLRNAFRKWIHYDLPRASTEVGVLLAHGGGVERQLALTALDSAQGRDAVASFLPYSAHESGQATCLHCAVAAAVQMLRQRARAHGGGAAVVVLVAPGMPAATDAAAVAHSLRPDGVLGAVHLAAVNYPCVATNRVPLDSLAAHAPHGRAFSVFERKLNGEQSYVTTYVQLANTLLHLSRSYRVAGAGEPLPLEIHRKTVYASAADNAFFVEQHLGAPAGFYVYTHSAETPHIQAIRLVAPSGREYVAKSDSRLAVRQLAIAVELREPGRWRYEIRRDDGNPQPHVVQVMATPQKANEAGEEAPLLPHVDIRSWVELKSVASGSGRLVFALFCEVTYGKYYPVRNALATATVLRFDRHLNLLNRSEVSLRDSGNGDSDAQWGDGIYSRYLEVAAEGSYTFEFYVRGIPQYTYTTKATAGSAPPSGQPAAGSAGREFGPAVRQEFEQVMRQGGDGAAGEHLRMTGEFERYGPRLTYNIDERLLAARALSPVRQMGRTQKLQCHLLGAADAVECSWPRPDFGYAEDNEARVMSVAYQLKYSFTVSGLVDDFERAAALFEGTQADGQASGMNSTDVVHYRHELAAEPHIHGRLIHVAVRSVSADGQRSLVSNVVQVLIPQAEPETTTEGGDTEAAFYHPPAADPAPTVVAAVDWTNSPVGHAAAASDRFPVELLAWTVPLSLLLLLVCSTLCLYCYVAKLRVRKDKQDTSAAGEANITPVAREEAKATDDFAGAIHPAHRSIGIPILESGEYGAAPCIYTIDPETSLQQPTFLPHPHQYPSHSYNLLAYDSEAPVFDAAGEHAPAVPPLPHASSTVLCDTTSYHHIHDFYPAFESNHLLPPPMLVDSHGEVKFRNVTVV